MRTPGDRIKFFLILSSPSKLTFDQKSRTKRVLYQKNMIDTIFDIRAFRVRVAHVRINTYQKWCVSEKVARHCVSNTRISNIITNIVLKHIRTYLRKRNCNTVISFAYQNVSKQMVDTIASCCAFCAWGRCTLRYILIRFDTFGAGRTRLGCLIICLSRHWFIYLRIYLQFVHVFVHSSICWIVYPMIV